MYGAIQKSIAAKILENIIFLEEIFGNTANQDIPAVPVLELAQCFEQAGLRRTQEYRRASNDWPLWR